MRAIVRFALLLTCLIISRDAVAEQRRPSIGPHVTQPGVAVWPTKPPPLVCGKPSLYYSVTHGVDNNFAATTTSPDVPGTSPSAYFSTNGVALSGANVFDQTKIDYHF